MIEFLTIMAIAAGYQLAVLPGEKVQFIIAALSTRYSPWIVVAAAGSAFAGWTAVELVVGQALVELLPGGVLDAFTGGLFVFFGVLLWRSAPEHGSIQSIDASDSGEAARTDGGVFALDRNLDVSILGWTVPDRFGAFLPIFAMMAAGEFGDKTQMVTIGLAIQYGAHPAIWAGEMLAIIPVSIANALFFNRFAHLVDMRKAHAGAAALFFFFGGDTLLALVTGFSVWEQIVAVAGSIVGPIWTALSTVALVSGAAPAVLAVL
jgi:putative Ca2+/H+ antiporter (TMEM165/GDT1 family)